MNQISNIKPEESVRLILKTNNRKELAKYIESLSAGEVVHLMSRLKKSEQYTLINMLKPEDAANVIGLPGVSAVDIIGELDTSNAAAIVNEMNSGEQVDLIRVLKDNEAEAILTEMKPGEAASVRQLIEFRPNTAGGLMITEYFKYYETDSVGEVKEDIRRNAERYKKYQLRYLYVVSRQGILVGVLQMQDLIMARTSQQLSEILIKEAVMADVNSSLDELNNLFTSHDFYGLPVVDKDKMLLGVLRRKTILEAINNRTNLEHLETQGIVGGEELRSMPVILRSKRRLSWLSVNILLNIMAASIIAFFQDTLQAVIALAVFLPIISDMSGCSGNQAVAVSMRELSLGIVRPSEAMRVWFQEVSVGLINGLVLGILIGLAAYFWKGNIYLGLVVGGALSINTVVAVSLGGTIPLLLKRFKVDPALASGPILTTVTDMVGFFLALSFASITLSKLGGM